MADANSTVVKGLACVGGVAAVAGLASLMHSLYEKGKYKASMTSAIAAEADKNAVINAKLVENERAMADLRRQLGKLEEEKTANLASIAKLTKEIQLRGGDDEARSSTKIRVYMDGCFDMMHFGHSNALRQARSVGDVLVVGLIGDDEIMRQKGAPPVMNMEERKICLAACKWVDEVIENAPYDVTREWTETLFTQHDIHFIVHGDDPCITADGKDAYATAKEWGRYKEIKRTEGVSTTDIVGRMLLSSRQHHVRSVGCKDDSEHLDRDMLQGHAADHARPSPLNSTRISQFLPTTRRIKQFSEGRSPKEGDRIVYVCGAFDIFHAGHVKFLEAAAQLGEFLLVGVHDDDIVNARRGSFHPLMNLHERVLSVLSCRFVDEVIIGAPWVITQDMLTTMNISVVAYGSTCDTDAFAAGEDSNASAAAAAGDTAGADSGDAAAAAGGEAKAAAAAAAAVGGGSSGEADSYAVPRELGMLTRIESSLTLSGNDIIERIMRKSAVYTARFEKKAKKETQYTKEKKFVAER